MHTENMPDGSRRRRGRPRSLTHEQIAQTALRLVDTQGIEALSMQRLAEAMGVGTMTIYGYFRTKDELLDAVVDAAVAPRQRRRARPSTAWREELRDLVMVVHRTLVRHPALVEIRLRRPVVRPEALRFGEQALGILLRAGFPAPAAVSAFRLLFTYVFGYAAISPERYAASAREQTRTALRALPQEKFPSLTANAQIFSDAVTGQEQFELGLETVLDGIAARRASRGSPV